MGKDIASLIISVLFLSLATSARANEGWALIPPTSALSSAPPPPVII